MKRFRVLHKITRAMADVSANSFWQACLYLGYKKEDCIGVQLSDRPKAPIKYYEPEIPLDLGG